MDNFCKDKIKEYSDTLSEIHKYSEIAEPQINELPRRRAYVVSRGIVFISPQSSGELNPI